MACYNPLRAYKTTEGDVTFDSRHADTDLKLPCGQCVGCRLARAHAWALRCVHEASLHKQNCFVTLTYSVVPPNGSLNYRHFQLFMKRLRKATKTPVRFFVCGEYGEKLERPHYHACLFGYDPPDKLPVAYLNASSGWRSESLTRLWGLGHIHIGELNVKSAGYAARYCLKKVTGDPSRKHYERFDADGALYFLTPEFARMSLRPGIGALWFNKYSTDVTGQDYLVHDGTKFSVPKYYDKLLKRSDPLLLNINKDLRADRALPFWKEGHPDRLRAREAVAAARLKTLDRKYEK